VLPKWSMRSPVRAFLVIMAAHSNGQAIMFLPCGFFFYLLMAALRSRCGHYIFALSLLSSFFPRLTSAVADRMSTILAHMKNEEASCATRIA